MSKVNVSQMATNKHIHISTRLFEVEVEAKAIQYSSFWHSTDDSVLPPFSFPILYHFCGMTREGLKRRTIDLKFYSVFLIGSRWNGKNI